MIWDNLLLGFQVAFLPVNLMYCFFGAVLGTLVGVLPGLGPVATIAMLMPLTLTLPPVPSIIMLAGIYYGAQYGGSTTAILVNIPGESSSMVTAIDGYKMAQQGRAGPALGIAAIGSFIAGCFATGVIAVLSPPLADIALNFHSAAYFSLLVLGLVSAVVLAHGPILSAIGMILLGLLLGLVGTDVNSGAERFTFGIPELADGVSFVSLVMGLFGLAEIAFNLTEDGGSGADKARKIGRVWPSRADLMMCRGAIFRGTVLGSILGILPGGGALLASFSAYTLEKKLARKPSYFGEGDIRGVAAPESANNAGAQTSFIPLLTLGLPSGPVMALILGALTIQGITPGPQVMTQRPDLFWGLIASMWIGNLMLVILNLPLLGVWLQILKIPYRLLFPSILVFCCIGAFAVSNSVFEIYSIAAFTVLGYVLKKLRCEPAPMVLGFILGRLIEEHMRRALRLSDGNPSIFVDDRMSLFFLIISVILLFFVISPRVRQLREKALQE